MLKKNAKQCAPPITTWGDDKLTDFTDTSFGIDFKLAAFGLNNGFTIVLVGGNGGNPCADRVAQPAQRMTMTR